jgi:glutamyl-tRNA reductase
MKDTFCYIGINYRQANLDVRDKISFTDSQKMDFMQRAGELGVGQSIVLSTCNRSEVFFFAGEEKQMAQMKELYLGMFPEVCLEGLLEQKNGREAIAYFFRIAAGLESMVLGEDQILGQVKEAAELSHALGYSGKELNYVVRQGITYAKKIKTELKISEQPLSVSYIGIQRTNAICPISGKHALVIGSGKTAALSLRYLYEYGAGQVHVCSRTLSHARDLLEEFPQLSVIPYEKRYEVLTECDIVISATASPHLVIQKDKMTVLHPMIFLDLAAPRDIDPAVEQDSRVTLINLDTLEQIAGENHRKRESLVEEGNRLIESATEETIEWLISSRVDSTIESLQQRCDEIVEDTYSYLNRKMELSTREQKLLRKMLRASLHRLLREPILELKQLDSAKEQETYRKVVEDLFHIDHS